MNNKIIIVNNSKEKIDSLLIYGNLKCKPLKFINIEVNEIEKNKLENCKTKKQQNDGSIKIKIFKKDTVIQKQEGYFSNGHVIFEELIIKINENNEVITKFK